MPSQFDGPLVHSVPVVELLGVSAAQGEKDWQKYETARRLKKCVDRIRTQYREDWKSKEMRIRQRAVALYFIDKVRVRVPDHRRHHGALLTQQRPTSQDKNQPFAAGPTAKEQNRKKEKIFPQNDNPTSSNVQQEHKTVS